MKALQVPEPVRVALAERSGGLCEVRTECQGRPLTQAHHRRPRGAGGSRLASTNTLSNLLAVCNECHLWIESNREDARDRYGWLVRQGHDPQHVPVLYSNPSVLRAPCRLQDDGTVLLGLQALTDEEMSTP